MATEKLVLRKQRRRPNDNLYRIRVSGEAYETVESLAEQTNMSMTDIASRMIMYALEHVEVEGEDNK